MQPGSGPLGPGNASQPPSRQPQPPSFQPTTLLRCQVLGLEEAAPSSTPGPGPASCPFSLRPSLSGLYSGIIPRLGSPSRAVDGLLSGSPELAHPHVTPDPVGSQTWEQERWGQRPPGPLPKPAPVHEAELCGRAGCGHRAQNWTNQPNSCHPRSQSPPRRADGGCHRQRCSGPTSPLSPAGGGPFLTHPSGSGPGERLRASGPLKASSTKCCRYHVVNGSVHSVDRRRLSFFPSLSLTRSPGPQSPRREQNSCPFPVPP